MIYEIPTHFDCEGPDDAPHAPSFVVPPLACDSHAHIVGTYARYPMVQGRSYTPPPASITAYRKMLATLGLQRAVIVQPSFYGFDNRCTRDALRDSQGAWRGVAVLPAGVGAAEIAALHEDGFRGARINLLFAGGLDMSALEDLDARIADFGWHLQILMDIERLPEIAGRVSGLKCDVVFDHIGHFRAALGKQAAGFRSMQKLLDAGRTWVKLSGGYRLSEKQPPYPDITPLAQALVQQRPDRLVWGSDWPHTAGAGDMPNDGALLDALCHWVPDERTRHDILVINPQKLYHF